MFKKKIPTFEEVVKLYEDFSVNFKPSPKLNDYISGSGANYRYGNKLTNKSMSNTNTTMATNTSSEVSLADKSPGSWYDALRKIADLVHYTLAEMDETGGDEDDIISKIASRDKDFKYAANLISKLTGESFKDSADLIEKIMYNMSAVGVDASAFADSVGDNFSLIGINIQLTLEEAEDILL